MPSRVAYPDAAHQPAYPLWRDAYVEAITGFICQVLAGEPEAPGVTVSTARLPPLSKHNVNNEFVPRRFAPCWIHTPPHQLPSSLPPPGSGHQPWVEHFAMIIGRNTAHIIMHGRQHRDRLTRYVNTAENAGCLGNAWQAFGRVSASICSR